MAIVLKDRVKETAAAPGTGTITLGGAVAGFQGFSAIGNGNITYFAIVDTVSGDWEVNYGTYTSSGTTLSRNATPLSSSAGGALVNFTGAVDVFVTYPSENAVWTDTAGVVAQQSFGAITATSAALTTGTVSTTPTTNTDIANKAYVDALAASGIHYHEPVYVEVPDTTGNLNATYNQPGGAGVGVGATLTNAGAQAAFTADGIAIPLNSRVLVYNQTNQFENGVYTLTTVGSGSTNWVLTRATDADTYAPFSPNSLGQGDAFFVTNGNTGAGETYICNTTGTITFGTTAITFAQISDSTLYTAGTGLTLSGTQFSITDTAVTAATYGSASVVPVFAVNAQGQVTGVTDTNIAINGSAVSGNISGSAGSVANALTAGSFLTSTGTFDGSVARTFAVDAVSTNTASKVVARDGSGNFAAGTITAALSGNATTATTATNVASGAANQIVYNTASGTTSFITAPTTSGTYLGWNGSAFTYSAISLPNTVTFNSGGTGDASGTTFNGSVARTISYNTVGASPLAGSSSLTTTGTVSSGTWSASFGAVSGANLTNLTAANISGTVAVTNGGSGASTASGARTNFGATTLGSNLFTITNPSAVTFPRFNADNTVSALDAASFRSAIGAGTSSATGTVTSVAGTGSYGGLTLTGTVTTSGSLTLGGTPTGTWPISVSGSAASATTATTATQVSNSHSPGTYITGSAFNGSSAQTWAVDATSANTASKVVARDGSGNFSAGTITASLSGNATSANNATTAGGLAVSSGTNNVANQIVRTNASGYADFGWINTISGTASGTPNRVYCSEDAYIRYYSMSTFTGYVQAAASGTWGINVTGSAGSATTATTATNVAGGAAGNIHYQSATGTTAFVTNGTSGQVLTSNGSSAPYWATVSSGGGLTLIAAVTPVAGATFVATTGIGSYKAIQVVVSAVPSSGAYYVNISSDNGATYSANFRINNSATPQSCMVTIFRTDTSGVSKPYQSTLNNDAGLITTVTGVINAVRIYNGGGFFSPSTGVVLFYGIN